MAFNPRELSRWAYRLAHLKQIDSKKARLERAEALIREIAAGGDAEESL
jgi:hypothetical protein